MEPSAGRALSLRKSFGEVVVAGPDTFGVVVDVRKAGAADADEVVRLRGLMLASMGRDLASEVGWERRCAGALIELLADQDFATFVVGPPGGALAGCVTVWIDHRLPGPGFDGRTGYVANLSTDPSWRRRGIGTALVEAALGWFRQRDVRRVDLHATAEGQRIYERAGFRARPAMRWEAVLNPFPLPSDGQ